MLIVFDFDKTLTKKDTLLGFYLYVCKHKPLRYIFLLPYFFLMLLTKVKVFSNDKLKYYGAWFFLSFIGKDKMRSINNTYHKVIDYNSLFYSYDFLNPNVEIVVITASFEDYVEPIFSPFGIKVFGSRVVKSGSGKILSVINCYGAKKCYSVESLGAKIIDEFYTDSFSDAPLVKLSKKTFLVDGDNLIECNDFEQFKEFFGK